MYRYNTIQYNTTLGAAHVRRAIVVAVVAMWRAGLGSPWALSNRRVYKDLKLDERIISTSKKPQEKA